MKDGHPVDETVGERPPVDDDGDVVLMHLEQPVWIRVRPEQPAIEISARVAHDVRSRRATAVELAVLNGDNPWVKWVQRDRTVWQHLVIGGGIVAVLAVAGLGWSAWRLTHLDWPHQTLRSLEETWRWLVTLLKSKLTLR